MKWKELKKPYRVELIKEVCLEDNNGNTLLADKENPVPGIITHYGYKKIGRNNVRMYRFWPDAFQNEAWEFSRNAFKNIRRAGEVVERRDGDEPESEGRYGQGDFIPREAD